MNRILCATRRLVSSLAVLLVLAGECHAATSSGEAWDVNVSVAVLGTHVLVVTPQAHVQYTNQVAAYEDSQSLPALTRTSAPLALATLTTGALYATTQWVPSAGFLVAASQSFVEDVHLDAASALAGGTSLLHLFANELRSTAIVSGRCPAGIAAAHTSGIGSDYAADMIMRNGFDPQNLAGSSAARTPGLGVSVNNTPLAGGVDDPAPNTTFTLPGVATLILHERTTSGDGITGASMTANALHLTAAVPALLAADVTFAHSYASITCN